MVELSTYQYLTSAELMMDENCKTQDIDKSRYNNHRVAILIFAENGKTKLSGFRESKQCIILLRPAFSPRLFRAGIDPKFEFWYLMKRNLCCLILARHRDIRSFSAPINQCIFSI